MVNKLAIADPPYLGRAVRWYGPNGRAKGQGKGRADEHPEAYIWDDPKSHIELVTKLNDNYDGWAIAMSAHSLSTYLQVIDTESENGIRVCVWHKPNPLPSGSRIFNVWEPVLVKVPHNRKGRGTGLSMKDLLVAPHKASGFAGAKPMVWTRWVLDLMGYQDGDIVEDLFAGSGSVQNAINQLTIEL